MPSRRSPRSRRSQRSPRRKRTATKLKLFAAQTGTMPEKSHTLAVKVRVGRNKMATSREHAFMACATFNKQTDCAESHNPMTAVGRVLAKVGGHVANRPAAMYGLGDLGGSRRRRRSRRKSRR